MYQQNDWWSGEVLELDEATSRMVSQKEPRALFDDCGYFPTDECKVPELREEFLFDKQPEAPPLLLDTLDVSLPCVTTDDGCSVEAGAALASADHVAAAAARSAKAEVYTQDPCWWEDGCYSFAS